jgi:hypothetical protein
MPRKRQPLAAYPQAFWDVVDKAHKGEMLPQLKMPSKPIAVSTRHAFNRFRQDLARENHPQAEAALDLVVQITNLTAAPAEGVYYLEFTPRGLYRLAQEMRGEDTGLPEGKDNLPDAAAIDSALAEPAGEKALSAYEKWFTPAEQADDKPGEHDWNEYDVCRKCGKPKSHGEEPCQ